MNPKSLEASLAQKIREGLDAEARRNKWSKKALWEETKIIPMTQAHLYGCVEQCYMENTIPLEGIRAIMNGERELVDEILMANGGMLNEFMTPPYDANNLPKKGKNVRTDFGEHISGAKKKNKGIEKKGAALVSKDDHERVLAFATWTESELISRSKREDSDVYTDYVINKIQGLSLDADEEIDQLLGIAKDTLVFDTICRGKNYKGASGLLFGKLVERWKKKGYEQIILWRNKALRGIATLPSDHNLREITGSEKLETKLGANVPSTQFFDKRGFSDLGTRLSDLIAVRDDTNANAFHALRATEGWVRGNMDDVFSACTRLDKTARAKHCH